MSTSAVLLRSLTNNAKSLRDSYCILTRFASLSTRAFSSKRTTNDIAAEEKEMKQLVTSTSTPAANGYPAKGPINIGSVTPHDPFSERGFIFSMLWTHKLLTCTSNEPYVIECKERSFTEVCPIIFKRMMRKNKRLTRMGFTKAVIIVPSCFDKAVRQTLMDASKLASIDVLTIVDTTTTKFAYNLNCPDDGGLLGVFDLCGGTFALHMKLILNFGFKVKESTHDSNFQERLMRSIAKEMKRSHGIDILTSGDSFAQLQKRREAIEKAEIELLSTWMRSKAEISAFS